MANYLYRAIRQLAGQDIEKATRDHTDHLTQAVLEMARHDPGARLLVVVNVQHCHIIREQLRGYADVEVADYTDL